MKIATFYDHIMQAQRQTGKSVEELLIKVRSYGIEGLEIHYEDLVRYREWLCPVLKRTGLGISCIYETYDFVTSQKARAAYAHIDMAKETGADRVLIIPGFINSVDYEILHPLHKDKEKTFACMEANSCIQSIREALTDLVGYAKRQGVDVTLEDYDDDRAPYSRIYQLLYFMERVPGLRYTYDMGNFAYADEDAAAAYEVLSPYLVHAHCKDRGRETDRSKTDASYCKGLACVPVGDGYLPIAEMIQRLKADGYQGYLAIEHFDAPDQISYLAHSAEFVRAQID